jgi:hypothetical protein
LKQCLGLLTRQLGSRTRATPGTFGPSPIARWHRTSPDVGRIVGARVVPGITSIGIATICLRAEVVVDADAIAILVPLCGTWAIGRRGAVCKHQGDELDEREGLHFHGRTKFQEQDAS